jgi:hypothetical protein
MIMVTGGGRYARERKAREQSGERKAPSLGSHHLHGSRWRLLSAHHWGPVGLLANGLLAGIQIVGLCLEERTTLDLAKHLQASVGGCPRTSGF